MGKYRMRSEMTVGLQAVLRVAAVAVSVWLVVSLFPNAMSAAVRAGGVEWPHHQSDLAPDPALRFGTLPNGFRYVLMPNGRPADRVSLHLNIQVGSLHEGEQEQGIAHFLEHMMFNGTEHFDAGELVRYFQSIGMQFGPDANAHTSFDESVYDILLPDGSTESLEQGLLVLRDYAQGALLESEEIDKERRVILAEKRSRDSASYRTFEAKMRFRFADSRISRRLPIGTEEDILAADRKRMKGFYDRWYRPEKMFLVAVGDFDPETLSRLVEKAFLEMPARMPDRAEPQLETLSHQGILPFHHHESESGSTSVSVEVVRIRPPQVHNAAFEQTQLLRSLGNRMIQHRLDDMLRKADSPFTSANAGSWTYLRRVETAFITAECEPANWRESLTLIEQTLRSALDHGFLDSELDRVKRETLSQLNAAVSQASTRESGSLARQIIWHLNENRVFLSPEQERELLAPMLDAVTAKAVHQAMVALWGADHRLVLVTGNARLDGGAVSPEEGIRSVFAESAAAPVSPPRSAGTTAFPYLPVPERTGRVAERIEHPDIGVTQVRFDNGVTLNLKPTDFKANEVQASVVFGYGKSVEPAAHPGLAEIAPEVVTESGLGRLSRTDLDRALAGTQTRVVFNVAEGYFQFRGSTVTEELELLLQLLHAHLLDPAFRAEAMSLVQDRTLQRIDTLRRTTDGALLMEGRRFLAGGDSRFGLPGTDAVRQLSLSDVRNWLEMEMRNAPLEISLVGDFDPDQALQWASRYFGSLPDRSGAAVPESERRPVFPIAEKRQVLLETKIPSALVVVSYPSDDIWDIGRTRRLNVLADIFSDRLRVRVREKLGASYSPFAFNRPSRAHEGYGVFAAMVEADPSQLEAVEAAIRQIAADLHDNGITADELNRALEPTLTGIKDLVETNGYWLGTVLSGVTRHPEQLEWSRTIRKDYAAITADQVTEAARKYLKNDKAAVFQAAPEATVAP